jgi:basic membrane protein A
MDGLDAGIAYYNEKNSTAVKLLGWSAKDQKGTFINGENPWGDPAKGKELAQSFFDQGCDVANPVSGSTGNGTYDFMMSKGAYSIGVDTDQALSLSQYAPTLLTSNQKGIDVAVFDTFKKNKGGDFGGEDIVGTLANGGVLISPYHDLDSVISAELKAAIDQLKADIIAGTVVVADYYK